METNECLLCMAKQALSTTGPPGKKLVNETVMFHKMKTLCKATLLSNVSKCGAFFRIGFFLQLFYTLTWELVHT